MNRDTIRNSRFDTVELERSVVQRGNTPFLIALGTLSWPTEGKNPPRLQISVDRQLLSCSNCALISAMLPLAFLISFIALACSAFGQAGIAPAKTSGAIDSQKGNGQEAFIIEQILTSETYESDGTGVYENSSRVRVLSQAGVQQFGLLNLAYEKNFQNADFDYVRVRKPDGSVINTPLDGVQDIDSEITRTAPTYSDLREKHIAVKSVAVGDVVEWHSVTHIFKPLVPGHFWSSYSFTKSAVVLDEQLRLNVPKQMYVNVKSPALQPQIREEGNRRIYEWKRSQPQSEDVDLKVKFGDPFEQPQPEVEISTFRSWDEVGRWYASLQRDRVAPTAEITAKALEITKAANSDDAKIRALYDFVATRFRYIGIAFGIGRYQPHFAADVLDNSYGDCKDKHTLLASLLQAIGIEASPAIISSSNAVDEQVPSPGQFDHVITVVHRGKDLIWLDTTSEVAPFGFLTQNLRDKKALVISPDGSASFLKTPERLPLDGFERFNVAGTLSDSGELKTSMQEETRGDGEIALRSAFHYVAQPQWKDLVQRLSYSMGFAGTVSDVSATVPEKTGEPFRFDYSYDRTDFPDWVTAKRITVPMPPLLLPDLNDEYMKSGEPVRLGACTQVDYSSAIKIPEGYSIQLPANVDIKTEFAEYHSKYFLKDGTLHAERQLTVLAKEVPASQYGKYREFAHKIGDDQGAWVEFSAAGQTAAAATLQPGQTTSLRWPPPPDTDAGHEFKDGIDLLRRGDVNSALDKFEEAGERDPKLPGIWAAIATIHSMRGDRAASVEDLRRQARETPNLPIAFAALGKVLLAMHKPEEALPALHRWFELAPDDRDAITMYGNALLATKKYPDAIDVFSKAVKQDPKRDQYEFQLGNAYLSSGKNDEAFRSYQQSINLALMKEGMQNDAAYQLADKGVHLDEAEVWARQAVTQLEEETKDLSLDNLNTKSLRLMDQLSAYWDTLGWICFKKAEYTTAESYLSASWWLRQNSVVGQHLAQVYDKLHQPTKASHFRQLADATPDRNGEPQTPEQAIRSMKSSWTRGEWDAHEQLGKMRTVHIATVSNKSESGEFFVLLDIPSVSPDANKMPGPHTAKTQSRAPFPAAKVEAVKFISGPDSLKKGETSLQHAQFAISLPENNSVKLVRRGILMCSPYTHGCDFTLLTTDAVHSVN